MPCNPVTLCRDLRNVPRAEREHISSDSSNLCCESTWCDLIPLSEVYRIIFARVLFSKFGKCGKYIRKRAFLIGRLQVQQACKYCEDFGKTGNAGDAVLVDFVCSVGRIHDGGGCVVNLKVSGTRVVK